MEFHQIILNHYKKCVLRPKSDHSGVIPASISGGLEPLTLHPVIILSCIASPPLARREPASVVGSLDRAGSCYDILSSSCTVQPAPSSRYPTCQGVGGSRMEQEGVGGTRLG